MLALQSENLILAAATPEDFETLSNLLEPYLIQIRESLHEAGEEPDWVYFPTHGIVSALTVLENGMMIEFATVGREGTTGVPPVVGLNHSNITPPDAFLATSGRIFQQSSTSSLSQAANPPAPVAAASYTSTIPPPLGRTGAGDALRQRPENR